MNKHVVAVSGKNGQLGSELQDIAKLFTGYDFVFADKEELDIASQSSLETFFEKYQPQFFVNCAAYTAVDKAESEKELSYQINATAVGNIATLCRQYNTTLIHISTDYVFNGTGRIPYAEDELVDPINHYGYTKADGEKLALQNHLHTIIIRTSWVYSNYGHNFVKTMLRLMKEKESIAVVNDQYGSPTNAADLAETVIAIVRYCVNNPIPSGIYHYGNEGNITWHDFAMAIKEISGLSCTVNAISTEQYPTPAKRPTFTVLDKQKIQSVFLVKTKDWRESLRKCIEKINTPV